MKLALKDLDLMIESVRIHTRVAERHHNKSAVKMLDVLLAKLLRMRIEADYE